MKAELRVLDDATVPIKLFFIIRLVKLCVQLVSIEMLCFFKTDLKTFFSTIGK